MHFKIKLLAFTALVFTGGPARALPLEMQPPLDGICKQVVQPGGRTGTWRLNHPRMALSPTAVFSTATDSADGIVMRTSLTGDDTPREWARFPERVRDITYHKGEVWLLFSQKILALDEANGSVLREVRTLEDAGTGVDSASGFAWSGDELYVAHGVRGMVVYDDSARKITRTHSLDLFQGGQWSRAIDVTILDDGRAVFAVEGVTPSMQEPFTFNGLIVLDPNAKPMVRKIGYDRRSWGVLANARIEARGAVVHINNWGILHAVDVDASKGKALIRWTPVKVEVDGREATGELMGDFLKSGQDFFSCAKMRHLDASGQWMYSGLTYKGPF